MRESLNKHPLPSVIIGFCAWFLAVPAWAGAESTGDFDQHRVSWTRLVFEGEKTLGKARTQIGLRSLTTAEAAAGLMESPHAVFAAPPDSNLLLVTADVEADLLFERKKWHGRVWFLPADGTALQRVRYKPGKGASDKRYRYGPDGVYRRRTEPDDKGQEKLPVDKWTRVRNAFFGYGTERSDCAQISDPLVLLYMVSALDMTEGETSEICVFNKKGLYRVDLATRGRERLKLDFLKREGQASERVLRDSDVVRIGLRSRPLDPGLKDAKAFEFMGLSGDIEILLDAQSGLPVGMRGELPVAGRTDFRLTEVNLVSKRGQ